MYCYYQKLNRMGLILITCLLVWPGIVSAKELDPNRFNRLMSPASDRNPSLAKDGIHDPAAPGIASLQAPKEAFNKLIKGKSGNYVDWVKSLEKGKIRPLVDLKDKNAKASSMDLRIIRKVKGTTPDVVFPHKAHTELIDCSTCHPDIFVAKKGANTMSMAEIVLGKKCGVCHGRVAFPVTECRRCHSNQKVTKKKSKVNKANSSTKK
ncbi:MAG: c(7)-type cytochrome triheme domain-containing protein [Thiohalomonadales bacterium]